MSNVIVSFILTSIAGLSTMIGSIFIFFKSSQKENFISNSLAFAAGVMLTVSLSDLIPESHKLLLGSFYPFPTVIISLIFIVVGILISITIDHILPENKKNNNYNNYNNLYKVGIISMLAIILHNIPEGSICYVSQIN